MYQLKQLPEDFRVTEASNFSLKAQGPYLYCKLIKINRSTLEVIRELARRLNLPEKRIGYAGNKDKLAITEQIISINKVKPEYLDKVHLNSVTLNFLGYGAEPITLGSHLGNDFEITIRNLGLETVNPIQVIENYFDEQRFSEKNCEIGRLLVRKKFKAALALIDDRCCNRSLSERPADFIGALKKLPLRLLRLYVHAYQSYLWNETVKQYLEQFQVAKRISYSLGELVFVEENQEWERRDLKIPLPGFGMEPSDEQITRIIEEVMGREQLTRNDFIIKQIPELSAEGELRKVLAEVRNLSIGGFEADELNQGQKKVKVTFSLPKGSYATMAVRKMVS